MSLLNEASFLVTPNGYKEDKLYAAIPTNGNGDMTVTRTGTATRVNEAGLVELVPYNLLLRSQEFDNAAWTKSASSIAPNEIVSPDGKMDADLLTASGKKYAFVTLQKQVLRILTSPLLVRQTLRVRFQVPQRMPLAMAGTGFLQHSHRQLQRAVTISHSALPTAQLQTLSTSGAHN
jgi:hypothetical protein